MNNKVLQPLKLISGIEFKNRIIVAPMTTQAGTDDGYVTEQMVEYYRSRSGTVAAIVVECAYVQRNGMAYPNGIGLENDEQIDGVSRISAAIRNQGSLPILQIYHGGRMVLPELIGGQQPVSASAVSCGRAGYVEPRELSLEEIDQMINDFYETTRRAIQAGFAGVEIHGANTYLLQQFFSPHSNRREDKWGGSREKRARFPLAVLEAVKTAVKHYAKEPFVVGYRFSPEELEKPGLTFDDNLYLLEKIAEKGIDYIHFSTNWVFQSSIIDITDKEPLIEKLLKARSDTLAKVPLIGVGNVKSLDDAVKGLDGSFDAIAVGKSFILEPKWLDKVLAGEETKTFIHKEDCEKLLVPESVWPIIADCMQRQEKAFHNKTNPRKDFIPGVYREKFADFHGMVNIDITLDKTSIKKIEFLTGKSGAPGVTVDAFAEMANRIISTDSTDVDVIAGATESCQSIIEAVNRVITKATGENISTVKPSRHANASWVGKDPEITADNLAEEIVTDVIVVGAGVAGTTSTRSAAEEGVKVVVIEKADSPQCRSGEYAVINGNVQARWGRDVYNPDEIADRFVRECAYRVKRPIIARWAHHCAEVFDWFIAAKPDLFICEKSLCDVPDEAKDSFLAPLYYPLPPAYNWKEEPFPTIPTSVIFEPNQAPVVNANMQKAVDTGNVTTLYGHFVEQLIKEDDRIVGVYARNAQTGKYIKVLANNGVILATGEYGSNKEMVDYFCPQIGENGVKSVWLNRDVEGNLTNTGDGLKMGVRIGAAIQQNHAPMTHHMGGPFGMGGAMGISPFLFLNRDGKRFMNEDVPGQQIENQLEMQPERRCYQIFDSNWKEQVEFMPAAHGVICGYNEATAKNNHHDPLSYRSQAEFDAELENGNMFAADSLEELMGKLDIDADQALASIARYNQLAANHKDEDFNKKSSRLFPIVQPPFYAVPFGLTVMLACCGGLESDEECHTFDENRNVIKGLYVAGNIQGNRYAVEYPICMKGVSHSMCMFYGYVAGKNCAHKK